jgi:hypothetical protein
MNKLHHSSVSLYFELFDPKTWGIHEFTIFRSLTVVNNTNDKLIAGVKEAGEKSFSGFPQFLKFIFSFIDLDEYTLEISRSLVNIETNRAKRIHQWPLASIHVNSVPKIGHCNA